MEGETSGFIKAAEFLIASVTTCGQETICAVKLATSISSANYF
jgi:hypothetical protein